MKKNSVADFFNNITDAFLLLYQSEYINFGYWSDRNTSVQEAQEALVKKFGDFSLLGESSKLIDLGFGTGEQDFFYLKEYNCKDILGLNISEHQISLANAKLNDFPSFKKKLKFIYGDATRLDEVTSEQVDRILALESAQLFPDKRAFLKGSWNKLLKGGYLCLAEPLVMKSEVFEPEHYSAIQSIIPKNFPRSSYFNVLLYEYLLLHLEKEKSNFDSKDFFSYYYDDYLKLIENSGFEVEAVENISREVLPFYEAFKEPVLKSIEEPSLNKKDIYFLINWLSIIYFRYYSFKNQCAGYYLIRAKKV
ncbi:MAG: class I SAM-dependent methyltransferase [Deltaproteobacteria bacterium]|nr:class I SAM-dependent methyltransferase [Deltaproteobacteria bacterium]